MELCLTFILPLTYYFLFLTGHILLSLQDLPAIKKYMASDSFMKTPVFAKMAKWGYE